MNLLVTSTKNDFSLFFVLLKPILATSVCVLSTHLFLAYPFSLFEAIILVKRGEGSISDYLSASHLAKLS